MAEAVLICNGLSAEGYEAPAGAYVCTINGGFLNHRADAAVTVDCPGHIRSEWHKFKGEKVVGKHMPEFPTGERFECFELVKQFSSATPAALAWLAQRKGFKGVTIVGCDSLWGHGVPGAAYNRSALEMVCHMAQYFPDGLTIQHNGRAVKVNAPEFAATLAEWSKEPTPVRAVPEREPPGPPADEPQRAIPVARPAPPRPERPARNCQIPQTMVEFDVSPGCTRRCAFCSPGISPDRRRQKTGLFLAAHNAAIDELVALGYNGSDRWLCYCGHGEPLLAPGLIPMLRYARQKLPDCKVVVYTNGDELTVELACALEANDIDVLLWDCYDAKSAKTVPAIIAASSLDPARVRVVDHTAPGQVYSSRCGAVKESAAAEWIGRPCKMPDGKLFVTDNGKDGGAAFLFCCEDYSRRSLSAGTIAAAVEAAGPARKALAAGRREQGHAICAQCDRAGDHPSGFEHVPKLTESGKFWPARVPPPKVKGKRLVVLATNLAWAKHAECVLQTIAAASTVPGETVLIWNDNKPMPSNLRMPGVTVWEYDKPLGWCGISRGFARAFQYAVAGGFDWTIKLDTDTAIICKGWDAFLCADCPADAQAGTYMDVTITGQLPKEPKEAGLFNGVLSRTVRWAARFVSRGLRGWDHIQGGCYVIGLEALRRIDRVVGLGAEDQDALEDAARVGEDVYLDTKCKLARVPQRPTLRALSWYREHGSPDVQLRQIRYHRDALGVCAEHPVKSLAVHKQLAGEIQ